MKCAVRYFSKSGNTKKLAEAIASELKVEALTVEKRIEEDIDVLFLGSAMYIFRLPKEIKKFIKDLRNVQNVVVFSTSAISTKVHSKISKLLRKRKIKCLEENFYCPGEYVERNVGRPNAEDLENVRKFTRKIVGGN